jgi:nitroimidazol reductase NimA-like FMN-containing flavoprotein (pyridoxamine 5'-phosphate oxidase superfamily)
METLTRADCLRLIGTVPIGRIVFTQRALPAIRLVNFALDGEQIVVRTGPGGKLAAAIRQTVVAFEADDVHVRTKAGWSVTVIGHAREVTDPDEVSRFRRLALVTWAPGTMDHIISIEAEIVTGRRLIHLRGIDQVDGTAGERG